MESAYTIREELKAISPLLAGMGKQMPFTLPPGYFEQLPLQLLLKAGLEEKSGKDPLLQAGRNNVYEVPQGYFDSLADNILKQVQQPETGAKEEIEQISPLLGRLRQHNPFAAPDNYFADFSDNLVAGVKAIAFVNNELENLSPLMLELRNRPVYEVPEGYFEAVAGIVVNRATQQKPARIAPFSQARRMLRYAAAAMVVSALATFSWFYINKPVHTAAMAGTGSISDIMQKVKAASDQEILSFSEYTSPFVADLGTDTTGLSPAGGANENDLKDLLADVSDEELQRYMDQRPETVLSN